MPSVNINTLIDAVRARKDTQILVNLEEISAGHKNRRPLRAPRANSSNTVKLLKKPNAPVLLNASSQGHEILLRCKDSARGFVIAVDIYDHSIISLRRFGLMCRAGIVTCQRGGRPIGREPHLWTRRTQTSHSSNQENGRLDVTTNSEVSREIKKSCHLVAVSAGLRESSESLSTR